VTPDPSGDQGSSLIPVVAGIGGGIVILAVIVILIVTCKKKQDPAADERELSLTDVPGAYPLRGSLDGSVDEYHNPVAETVMGTEAMWEATFSSRDSSV
jgi:hypothetical protein